VVGGALLCLLLRISAPPSGAYQSSFALREDASRLLASRQGGLWCGASNRFASRERQRSFIAQRAILCGGCSTASGIIIIGFDDLEILNQQRPAFAALCLGYSGHSARPEDTCMMEEGRFTG